MAILPVLALAVPAPGQSDAVNVPTVHVNRLPVAPVIDGRVGEEEWAEATRLGPFTQVEPVEGARPSLPTTVLLGVDRDHFYLAVICPDREPGRIITTTRERDARLDPHDRIEFILDTWDGIFESRSSVTERGWEAEFAIPAKTLKLAPGRSRWRRTPRTGSTRRTCSRRA